MTEIIIDDVWKESGSPHSHWFGGRSSGHRSKKSVHIPPVTYFEASRESETTNGSHMGWNSRSRRISEDMLASAEIMSTDEDAILNED